MAFRFITNLLQLLKGNNSLAQWTLFSQLSASEMFFRPLIARTDNWKGSLFPQTIEVWNTLPDSIFSLADGADDGIAKFTSLVRVRD